VARGDGVTVWMTGLSGSGKSTISDKATSLSRQRGMPCVQLDGDIIRKGLCGDLGFSPEDRKENIRRVAEVAKLFNQEGYCVIVSLISPMKEDRENARRIIGKGSFLEVYISTPLDICESRDVKGLYKKARSGIIPQFTGLTAPYEPPDCPDLKLDTSKMSLQEEAERVVMSISEHQCKLG